MNGLRAQMAVASFAACMLTASLADATTIQQFVDGRSGPWTGSVNPSFNWGVSTRAPVQVNSSRGLAMTVGDVLTITYVSGIANGGGAGIYGDANGNAASDGNVAGTRTSPGQPSYDINPSVYPVVYFMALLGAFTDSAGVIVGQPFLIGDGPFVAVIPAGATTLSMGFNDGGSGFFDNGGGVTMQITESLPEPGTLAVPGVAVLGMAAVRGRVRVDRAILRP